MKPISKLLFLSMAIFTLFSCDPKEEMAEIAVDKDFQVNITSTTPASPSDICIDEWVEVSFNYKSDEDNVLVFIRPFTDGDLTPNYAAEASSLLPLGNGAKTTKFKISSGGDVTIDQLRIQMFNSDQSELLLEKFVAVEFNVVSNGVTITEANPATPATLKNNEWIEFDYDYKISQPEGAQIFIRPFTEGSLSPNYAASGSPIFNGTGSDQAGFTITSGEQTHVDQLRITIYDKDNSVLLSEQFVDTDITFKGSSVNITEITPNDDLAFGEKVQIAFEYDIVEAEGARIFIRPFSNGALSPGYAASGSPIFTGDGNYDVNFTISSGDEVHVDQLRIQILSPDQSTLISEKFVDVDYTFN